jgi:thiol-disulfide isomerase/thioredoxin
MKLFHTRSLCVAFILLFSSFIKIHSQTHLKLILKTSLPIDSALIVHFTNQEGSRLAFKDTLDMDFKTGKTDFYHINYVQKEKIFNERIFLDSGNIIISMRIENDKLVIDKVVGSPLFDKVQSWKKSYAAVVLRKDSSALDSFLLKTYEEQIDNMFSFNIGSRYLNIHQNNKLKLYPLLPLLAKQDDELKKLFGFSFLNDRLQGIIKNNIVTLSKIELIDPGNKTVHALPYNTDFVILDFWFVGCVPCMEDHKKIKGLLPYLKKKKTELISISNDESYEKWKDYLKDHHYSWPQYKKPATVENIISQLGISTYPTYILLDKAGKIVFSSYNLNQILKQLD